MRAPRRLNMMGPRVATAKLGPTELYTSGPQRARGAAIAKIKAEVAKRSRGLCECPQCQNSGHPLPAEEFDHRVPLWEGGGDTFENFQHLSRPCHRAKSERENRRRLGLED